MEKNKPKPRLANPRHNAVRALQWVFGRHKSLDLFLEQDERFAALSDRDRALSRAIIGTCLRRMGQIDAILDKSLEKPLPRQALTARLILRAGAAELLFLRSAAHGVVHSFVAIAGKERGCRPYKGLINAVLRKTAREADELLAQTSIDNNIPHWLSQSWQAAYGADATTRAAEALQNLPALNLTVLKNADQLAQELGGAKIGAQTLQLQHKGKISELAGFDSGQWIVQGVSAALPAQILNPKPGEDIADLCAAPGGKTIQLANAGANVTAVDSQETRLNRLQENLLRTGQNAKIVCADAQTWAPKSKFDAILLDAPCSATGIFLHHPDVLYNRRAKDIAKYSEQQIKLAIHGASLLRENGRMVYCVCSAQVAEGEQVLQKIIEQTDLILEPIDPKMHPLSKAFLVNGAVRIPPGAIIAENPVDSFFIALLRKPGARPE